MKTVKEAFGQLIESMPDHERLANILKGRAAYNLTKGRVSKGLKPNKFAEMLGVSERTLSRMENGDYNFTLEQLSKICVLLDIDYKDIL